MQQLLHWTQAGQVGGWCGRAGGGRFGWGALPPVRPRLMMLWQLRWRCRLYGLLLLLEAPLVMAADGSIWLPAHGSARQSPASCRDIALCKSCGP